MAKHFEVSDMPPLSREVHGDLRQIETQLNRDLLSCCGNYDLSDPHGAFEYTRTAAIEFFDCFYAFYSKIPDPVYREHWKPASEKFALGRIVRCIENIGVVETHFQRNNRLIEGVKRTISDHAKSINRPKETHPELTGRQIAGYARAGIDLKEPSPLLAMALEAQLSTSAPYVPTSPPKSSSLLADQLRDLREESHLTTEEIAELIGIKPRNVYKHLAGVIPRAKQIKAYEDVFTANLGRTIKLKRQ